MHHPDRGIIGIERLVMEVHAVHTEFEQISALLLSRDSRYGDSEVSPGPTISTHAESGAGFVLALSSPALHQASSLAPNLPIWQ